MYLNSADYESFYRALKGRKGTGNSHLSNAEINVILEDGQMSLLGFCAVQKYLPIETAACHSLQNMFLCRTPQTDRATKSK